MQKLIADYLSDNAESLRLLNQAAAMKACRYPVVFSNGFMTKLPHLAKVRHAAQLLELESIHEAEEKQSVSAATAVATLLGVARSLDREPCFISCEVEASIKSSAMESLERVLSKVSLSDSQLVSLAVAIQESASRESMTRAFAGERAMGISWFIGDDASSAEGFITGMVGQFGARAFVSLADFTGILQEDEKVYLDFFQRFVSATQLHPPDSIAASLAADVDVGQVHAWHLLLDLMLVGRAEIVITGEATNMKMTAAQVALAIECYRLTNNRLPEQLDDLVPRFLPAVPMDSFDGKPLRYKRLTEGYVVYSVGNDREDNGGTEKNSNGLRSYVPGTDITFTVER